MYPRLTTKLTTMIFILAIGLTACSLPFGTSGTPTPEGPTSTPEPPTATPVPAAATVNGEILPLVDYEAELARYKSAQAALDKTVSDADAARVVLEDLVSQVLLAQGARAAGLSITEADLQSRIDALTVSLGGADKLSAWQSAHGYTDESFRAALKRSAEAALMRDKIIADVPGTVEQVHARQILLYNDAAARSVLEQLKTGVVFDELLTRYNTGSQLETRGDLGWFPKGYLLEPAIEEAAFALQPGQFSDVIATEVGFHIIYIVERGPHLLSPDARLVLQEQAVIDWVNSQRVQASIQLAP
jgi:peptidyl-prolyl cis-trans isomerase C